MADEPQRPKPDEPKRPVLFVNRGRARKLPARSKFRTLLRDAIRHFGTVGYTSKGDLQQWLAKLHAALDVELPDDKQTHKLLRTTLDAIYNRDVTNLGVTKRVPGVVRYTLQRIDPSLRAELDKRIFAAADLIRINREQRIQETLRRFAGWVSSVPLAGAPKEELRRTASEIAKPAARVKFEARRVAIDQGHKLSAAVAHVVARGEGAIAAIWHDRGEFDKSYKARPEHLARSGKLFLIRDSWALDQGLVTRRARPYTDEIEQVAEFPFCSCTYEYITSPRELPSEFLTAKGRAWIIGLVTVTEISAVIYRIEHRQDGGGVPITRERAIATFARIRELHSVTAVAEEQGVTTATISFVLRRGRECGWLPNTTGTDLRWNRECQPPLYLVVGALNRSETIGQAAAAVRISRSRFCVLWRAEINAARPTMRANRKKRRRQECINDYRNLCTELGRIPGTSEISRSQRKTRCLGQRIQVYFGSWPAFWEVLGGRPNVPRRSGWKQSHWQCCGAPKDKPGRREQLRHTCGNNLKRQEYQRRKGVG